MALGAGNAIARCRVCGNRSLIPCISLGPQYLSAVFPSNLGYRAEVPKLPLDLVLCERRDESACGLLQLAHEFDLGAMYKAYPYTSATNSSMSAILQDVASSGLAAARPGAGDVILDIGCNDGTLVGWCRGLGCRLVGVDPAGNVEPALPAGEMTSVQAFFSEAAYRGVADRPAKLVFTVAMFYHVPDPVAFARDVAACLDPEGVWVIQMAYLPAMLRSAMYDNIVHEHVGYYAGHHLEWIMERAGLEVFDIELNDVYGGSFRVFVRKPGRARYPITDRCRALLEAERRQGLFAPATYAAFMRAVERRRADLRELCHGLKAQGKSIWVYGASTKGNTILQYCGLGAETLTAAADANPFKVGKYVVGADIPITDEATMRRARPDYLLALPYSFVEAFMKREAALVGEGTRFIVPLPEVRNLP